MKIDLVFSRQPEKKQNIVVEEEWYAILVNSGPGEKTRVEEGWVFICITPSGPTGEREAAAFLPDSMHDTQ